MSSSSGGTEPRLARRLRPMLATRATISQAGSAEPASARVRSSPVVGAGMGGWSTGGRRSSCAVTVSTTAVRNSSIRLPIPNSTTPTSPPSRWKPTAASASSFPSRTRTSSSPRWGRPKDWIRTPYCSLQNVGSGEGRRPTRWCRAIPASRLSAACAAMSVGIVQCSIRQRRGAVGPDREAGDVARRRPRRALPRRRAAGAAPASQRTPLTGPALAGQQLGVGDGAHGLDDHVCGRPGHRVEDHLEVIPRRELDGGHGAAERETDAVLLVAALHFAADDPADRPLERRGEAARP